MVLTVTEDTPADMLAGSMELLVQMPRDHHVQTQRVTVQRSTPMMDLLVQIATAHKLAASSYTLQAIGERGLVLPHQPNTPIGALDALQVKLLPKQGTFLSRKSRQTNQPFETTFRLQVHLPRNQLYVSRVSPKTNLGEILDEVCREKNLDRNKYELRHPANISEILNLSHTLQDYHLQEVTLCARQQSRGMIGSALSSQDIMALQKQEECRRQQNARQSVFGFMFKKSKESSLSTDSLGNRSVSPARSDETARSSSPIQQQPLQRQEQKQEPPPPPARPLRKRRPAPKPPTQQQNSQTKTTAVSRTESKSASDSGGSTTTSVVADKDKIVISHSRNSSDSSGYHEASVLSDNPDNATSSRMPETLPRRGRMQGILETPRKLAHTSQASKSLGNLAMASSHGGGTLTRGISNTSLSSAGQRKKRVAPPPPMARPLPSAISAQGLERIVDSDESLTSDMDLSKPSSDIDVGVGATGSSKASSDIGCHRHVPVRPPISEEPHADAKDPVEPARVVKRDTPTPPVPRPRKMLRAPASPSPSLSSTSTLDASSPSSQFEFCRVVACSSPAVSDVASFGLPSLTEDEREEIALAIDSIVEAAKGHGDDDSMSLRSESGLGLRRDSQAFAQHDILRAMERDEEVKRKDSVKSTETIKSEVIVAVSDVDVHVPNDEPKEDRYDPPPETDTPPATPPPNNDEDSTKHSVAAAPFCAVISTIPKCDHLESYTDNDFGKEDSSTPTLAPKRRGKVARSQSEMGHFEVGTPEKHGNRHLTSNVGAAIAYALNPNLGEAATRRIEAAMSLGEGKAPPTDTDILLQKVSDALSSRGPTTPPSPPPTPEDSLEAPDFAAATKTDGRQSVTAEPPKGFENESSGATIGVESTAPVELNGKESTSAAVVSDGNATLGSQQDTSDYVSASGEDLSIGDWEYQIPAPPSAFRDDNEPVEEVATKKHEEAVKEQATVEPIKAPISIEAEIHHPVPPTTESQKQSTPEPKPSKPLIERTTVEPATVDSVDFCAPKPPKPITPQLSHEEAELKKAEVISELETKINSNRPIVEPAVVKDDSYAPKIAPAENNLSNFTITTYSRQKSLDIFEQMDHDQQQNENRVLNTFATLQRGRSMAADYAEERMKGGFLKNAQSMERVAMTLVDDRAQFGERNDILREKSTVQINRSKSYIVLSSNEKFQNRANEIEKSRDDKYDERLDCDTNDSSRKYTSLANVNSSTNDDMPRHKEKFSQWRDNILRNQKEPTEEKQLQSLQVLKSILPKLKNSQVTESNGYKSANDNFTTKKQQEPQPDHARDSSPVTTTTTTEVPFRANRRQEPQVPAKRYTYCGPPAVSLGSWSERPCVNVQIKTDTDYKFGGSKNNGSSNSASGARTIVSLNGGGGGGNEVSERMTNGSALTAERKEPTIVNSKSAGDGVKKEEKDESRVDTSSVNFRELTKAFGQAEVRLRSKPLASRPIHNRHSEYIDRSEPDSLTPKQNGFAENGHQQNLSTTTFGHLRTNGPPPLVRRYTSVVGINNNNNNDVNENKNKASSQPQTHFRFTNGHGNVVPKPPVAAPKAKEYVVPKPPTMPIITGVTLKSVNARPKSSPPTTQADPRDQLLESIRNFGGREKLRSSAERY